MNTPLDNRGPTPTKSATEVWIWTDGQVGGPFPLPDVEALVASGEAPPGLLARTEGGEWMPWPAFCESVQPTREDPAPVPDYPIPDNVFAVEYLAVSAVLIIMAIGVVLLVNGNPSSAAGIGVLASTLLGLAAYFVPTFVAVKREHRQRLAIIVLNLVGGWTVVGWIVALVWACTESTSRPAGTTD